MEANQSREPWNKDIWASDDALEITEQTEI